MVAPEQKDSLVAARQLQTSLISATVKFHIYLPPTYASEPSRNYPVIYWLHGSGGFPKGAMKMLSARFHEAINTRKIQEAIVVFPDGFGQSMWLNDKDNQLPMEDIFIQEVIPHIDANYRTIKSKNGRVLEGGSMGGYGAARFGFKYTELFAAISMLNPGPMQKVLDVDNAPIVGREGAQNIIDRVYGGDLEYFKAQSPWRLVEENADKIRANLKIRMILGELDQITINNKEFSERLKELGVEHEVILLADAGHNPREMFAALGPDYWRFFKEALADQ